MSPYQHQFLEIPVFLGDSSDKDAPNGGDIDDQDESSDESPDEGLDYQE